MVSLNLIFFFNGWRLNISRWTTYIIKGQHPTNIGLVRHDLKILHNVICGYHMTTKWPTDNFSCWPTMLVPRASVSKNYKISAFSMNWVHFHQIQINPYFLQLQWIVYISMKSRYPLTAAIYELYWTVNPIHMGYIATDMENSPQSPFQSQHPFMI